MRGCNDRAALRGGEAGSAAAAAAAAGSAAAPDTLLASLGVTAPLVTQGQRAAAAAAGASSSEPEPPVQKQQQQMWGIMGFGGLFIDNYQLPPDPSDTQQPDQQQQDPLAKGLMAWASPLQHDWAASSTPQQVSTAVGDQEAAGGDSSSSGVGQAGAAGSAAGLVAAATAVAAAAQPPPASALSLAMRLVEGSQAAGITGEAGGREGGLGCCTTVLLCSMHVANVCSRGVSATRGYVCCWHKPSTRC